MEGAAVLSPKRPLEAALLAFVLVLDPNKPLDAVGAWEFEFAPPKSPPEGAALVVDDPKRPPDAVLLDAPNRPPLGCGFAANGVDGTDVEA